MANHCPERFPDSTPKPTASLSLRSGPTNQGVELKKRRRKFPLNTCVHSDSKAVGRRRGANGDGPSGAVSAAAGNCGPCLTRCKGTLSLLSHALSQWYLSEWVILLLLLSGTSQDRTVSSRAPLAGGIGEQQYRCLWTIPGESTKGRRARLGGKPHRFLQFWTQKKVFIN